MGKRTEQDQVTPDYYKGDTVLTFIETFNLNFSLGSVIKYVARAGHKDDRLIDLKKARTYLDREIMREEIERRKDDPESK